MSAREERFERMLADLLRRHTDTLNKMEQLRKAERTKTATYRQLMGQKLTEQNMLDLYRLYGLLDESEAD